MRKAHNCGIEAGEVKNAIAGLLSFSKLACTPYGGSNFEIQPASRARGEVLPTSPE